jgi:hypothetical protein
MRRLLWVLALSALSLCADVTGKWSGTIQIKNDQGESKTEPAFMILKQEGTALTGSGGPNEGHQMSVRNGKIEGNKLTFEIAIGESGDRVMHFTLTASDDQIDGNVTAPSKESGGPETAVISLKRVKAD